MIDLSVIYTQSLAINFIFHSGSTVYFIQYNVFHNIGILGERPQRTFHSCMTISRYYLALIIVNPLYYLLI